MGAAGSLDGDFRFTVGAGFRGGLRLLLGVIALLHQLGEVVKAIHQTDNQDYYYPMVVGNPDYRDNRDTVVLYGLLTEFPAEVL